VLKVPAFFKGSLQYIIFMVACVFVLYRLTGNQRWPRDRGAYIVMSITVVRRAFAQADVLSGLCFEARLHVVMWRLFVDPNGCFDIVSLLRSSRGCIDALVLVNARTDSCYSLHSSQ
jgi:hypothetical protein